ncbi:MAG: DegT/DnrJ/EryC1/StrS family aminotransferase [Nanoarchaeota archaeon]
MDKETYELLKNITNKEYIKLVPRGNKAILYALRIAKKLGKKKVLIQDQGGWITYKQFPVKLKMELEELKTDYGLLDINDLKKKADADSVLLINSLTGYFAVQDMLSAYNLCFNAGCLVINDITGSIGTESGKVGDILVGSFGNAKPVDYGQGGMIAVGEDDWFNLTKIDEVEFDDIFYDKLFGLQKRLTDLKKITKKIKKDLSKFEIIHKDKDGINVVVGFLDDAEKEEIISYCDKNKYEYTICPRYIRVSCDAVSIEVKRL